MNRLEATRRICEIAGEAAIVASLGHPTYDLFAAADRPRNFYTWGSMGLASSIGLGIALARPDLRAFVLDGDGSLLMNLGSLATIGLLRPDNLVVVVMDNEEYATTGGQQTPTAHGADLAAAATAVQQVVAQESSGLQCSVLGTRLRTSATNAALANGTAAHAHDYDDMCFVSLAHPSAPLVAAGLAIAELSGATGRALLEAYVVGFEI